MSHVTVHPHACDNCSPDASKLAVLQVLLNLFLLLLQHLLLSSKPNGMYIGEDGALSSVVFFFVGAIQNGRAITYPESTHARGFSGTKLLVIMPHLLWLLLS